MQEGVFINVSGDNIVVISGSGGSFDVAGFGDVEASDLMASSALLSVAGSGDIKFKKK